MFPLHQSSEPIAFAGTDRNFYDRYFFNGYSPDGSVFFAAAMGFYPQLGVVDASFCVLAGGVQYNLRASRRSGGERLDLSVGPITVSIDVPLEVVTLHIAPNVEWVPHGGWADYANTTRAPGYTLLGLSAGATVRSGWKMWP